MRWTMALWLVACTAGKDTATGGGGSDSADTSGGGGGGNSNLSLDGGDGYTDLSDVLTSVQDRWGVPSIAASIIRSDDLAAYGAVGLRSADADDAVALTDPYFLGACTKAMTATLVGVLVDEGVLAWDAPVGDLLPSVSVHADFEDATLAMMLWHTGGAWSDLDAHAKERAILTSSGDPVAQRAAFAEAMLSQAPEYLPEDSSAYSDAGYVVIGAIVEAATGEAWEDLVADRVFAPLGMDSCGFGAPDDGSLSAPWGHNYVGAPVSPGAMADYPPAMGPAGTVHCSLEDWGRFAAAHLDGARDESTWLQKSTWHRLHAIRAQSYAMGWSISQPSWAGGAAFSHPSTLTTLDEANTFYSVIWLAPELDTAWLVTTNAGAGRDATDDLLDRLIKMYGQ